MAASGESFPQHIYRSPSAVPEAEPLDTNRLTEKNPEYPRSITEWTTELIFMPTIVTRGFVAALLGKSFAAGPMPARFWFLPVLRSILLDASSL